MKQYGWRPAVVLLFLGCALANLAYAGTIDFSITGTLGPLLEGQDPLGVSGHNFDLTGTLPTNLTPISTTADSATYRLPDTIAVTLGRLTPVGTDVMLTLTDPANGPDTLALDFTANEFGFAPTIYATLILPDGTLKGAGIQEFAGAFNQPDSSVSYTSIGVSSVVEGTVGLTGTATFGGGGLPSSVPEPGTWALLAGGLAALVWKVRRY